MRPISSLCFSALFAVLAPSICAAQARDAAPDVLPVRQVTLFSSGVAYMERRGDLDGNATVPLSFRVGQINDILKSMVLLDSSGMVQAATYTARDPIGRTLQSFAVDVSGATTMQQILTQLRGARVAVEAANLPRVTGRIVSVEQIEVARPDGKPIMALFVNLLTEPADGKESALVALRLDGERQVRFLDDRINREFQSALGLLATGTDDQRRQVTLHFAGAGRREVRVGYVVEAPIWKMSYRLMIGGAAPANAAGKPYLQGWAMVENTSDDDWKDVKLSLVSGRPVSFIEDLYQPLYLHRPEVAPDAVASASPQTHDSDLGTDKDANAIVRTEPQAKSPSTPAQSTSNFRAQARAGGRGALSGFAGPAGAAGEKGDAGTTVVPSPVEKPADMAELLRQSVVAQATGEKAGALFQYRIDAPLTLPRQQAALIPVVAQDVEADKVLLFNADSGSRFPLDAVRVHNVTGLHLKGGPVTLFDQGVYAGDARMEDIPPGDTRLLSYAVDLTVEGERQKTAGSNVETSYVLKRGVLQISVRSRMETTYSIKSKSDKAQTVLVEHPFVAGFNLIAPAAALERTAAIYRFAVKVAPGKAETLKIVQEKPIVQTVTVIDSDVDTIVGYISRKEVSAKLKATLQEIIQRRRHVDELQAAAANRAQEVQSISGDQERIRKNMGALDKASALYKRYVSTLDSQETKIESLRQDANRLRGQAETAETDLRAYLDKLPTVD